MRTEITLTKLKVEDGKLLQILIWSNHGIDLVVSEIADDCNVIKLGDVYVCVNSKVDARDDFALINLDIKWSIRREEQL
jgi:hypothetical protein